MAKYYMLRVEKYPPDDEQLFARNTLEDCLIRNKFIRKSLHLVGLSHVYVIGVILRRKYMTYNFDLI